MSKIEGLDLKKETNKLKKEPQYIDYFSKQVSQKWVNNKEEIGTVIQEVISYYKDKEDASSYKKLLFLQEKNNRVCGKFEQSIQLGASAYSFFEKVGDTEGLAIGCYISFVNHMRLGEFEKAVGDAVKGFEWAAQEGNDKLHLLLLLNTAELYVKLKAYERARSILNSILEMDGLITEDVLIFIERNLLEINLKEDQLEEATLYAKRAYKRVCQYEKDTNTDLERDKILCLRAELNAKRGLDAQAEKDFKGAYEHAQEEGIIENQILILKAWANDLYLRNEMALAKEKIELAIEKAKLVAPNHYKTFIDGAKGAIDLEPLNDKIGINGMAYHKKAYDKIQQLAQLGTYFTSHLEENTFQETMPYEMAKLLEIDMMGLAVYKNQKLDYKVYEMQHKGLDDQNDLVRYTLRLVEHCVEYHEDIVIVNGNFEAYSLKTIKETQSQMQLKSAMVIGLKVQGQIVGAMVIGSYYTNAYSANDLSMAGMMASYLAITLKNRALYQQVMYLEEHDALTGVLTRGAILKKGESVFKNNHKRHQNTAIIRLDIDYLKKINDQYGYELGDQVLKKVGQIIQEFMGKKGNVGRYGGEEFIIILDDVNHKEVVHVAECIKGALEKTVFETKKKKRFKVTLSGGIYICDEYTLNLEDAIRFANHALYRAKIVGRNQMMCYNLSETHV